MKLNIIKEEGNVLEFELEGVSDDFVNAIRRYIINSVPVLAIDEVVFYDNTSSFFDEYIAHRLGLIPITTPSKIPENAEIVFHLDAEGPKIIYAEELKSTDPEIKPAQGKIPIVRLREGQTLRLEAVARVGTARKHAKFQAGLAAYEEKDGVYKFMVESFYQMTPRELVLKAVDVLVKDLNSLKKSLPKK